MKRLIALFTIAVGLVIPSAAFCKDDIVVKGTITAITATDVTVDGTSALFTPSTEFRGLNDEPLQLTDFQVNDFVKLKLILSNGALYVDEMEFEDESSSSSSSSGFEDDDDDDNSGSGSHDSSSGIGDDDDDDDSGSNHENEHFRSDLSPDPASIASGKVRARIRVRSKEEKRRLRLRARLAIPSTSPAVADLDAAANLDVRALLSRDGIPYAECTLSFHEAEEEHSATFADYRLELKFKDRKGSARLRSKNGGCDTDLATPDVQSGMPDINAGDTLEVSGDGVVFLTGTF